MKKLCFTACLLGTAAFPAFAENAQNTFGAAAADTTGEGARSEEDTAGEIIVIAQRIRGAVDTEVPPVEELDEAQIAAAGVSSITDLLAAVAPQTTSGRGRGSGQPIVLLNGQRVSGFRELRDLPPEAVRQVQIFPEEVALKYGFRPDQRVINFILKDNFSSFSTEFEHAQPQDGGFASNELEATLTRIGANSRFNLDLELERRTGLTENERDLIPANGSLQSLGGNVTGSGVNGEISPALSTLAGSTVAQAGVPIGIATPTLAQFAANADELNSSDIGQYRTLLPKTERLEINATMSRRFGPQTTLSINGNYALNGSSSLLGLPAASFTLPGSSPFSPFGTDVLVNRYFDSPRALERENESHAFQTGTTFNTLLDGWRWTVTGSYDRTDSETRTARNVDFAPLRSAVLAGTANPFATDFGNNLLFLAPDISDSLSQNINVRSTVGGSPLTLWAGEVGMTFSSGFNRQMLDSEAIRSGAVSSVSLRRNVMNHNVNAELPLLDREAGLGRTIGELAINGNIGISDLSDVGTLFEYGAGLRWSPARGLTFQASIIGDESAPGIVQLGNPLSVTPNVATYDFIRGESLFIDVITGGNTLLVSEKRRDLKLGVNWNPGFVENLGLQVEYFKNDSRNTSNAFPLLTSEIEAAFADRVTRDASGRLISIDQRPVNFDRESSQRIRSGFNISGSIGGQPEGRARFGGGNPVPGESRRGGNGGGRPPGMGRMGGGGFGPGGGMPSRWNIALYHSYRLEEAILIRPGVPVLDLLDGSATSSNGGASRHQVELSGGVFYNGLGLRLEGNYRSGTRVDGTGLPGSNDLRFDDLLSLNAFLFVNLEQQKGLVKAVPWLKGSRITLRVDNVLNDIVQVRDQNGEVPLGYQPGYLDPRGRVFELSFRKRF